MSIHPKYENDIEMIMSHRYDLGGDYWTTQDHRLIKGTPFSMVDVVLLFLELGMDVTDPLMGELADLIFSTWKKDGRFKVYPSGGIYPCQTTIALSALCHMGFASDERLQLSFQYLLATQYKDGGWRCSKFSFGRGEETEYSNPHPTLMALDAFRYTKYLNQEKALDQAVEFLLAHWRIKKPIGPCHYGIGKLFMQVAYPFDDYNLFVYVYVLSFYDYAKKDERFLEAFHALQGTLSNGMIVVARTNRKLAHFSFCEMGKPSELATCRYHEILENLNS